MVPGVVKESSGLYTVTSTLYLQPEKKDTKSVFHCTVEYRMPNGEIKKENSDHFNLTLLCESHTHAWTPLSPKQCETLHDHVHHLILFSYRQTQPRTCSSNCWTRHRSKREMRSRWNVRQTGTLSLCSSSPKRSGLFFYQVHTAPSYGFSFHCRSFFVSLSIQDITQSSSTGLFVLHNVTRNDAGTYTCEAMDFDAVDISLYKTLTLNVHCESLEIQIWWKLSFVNLIMFFV